MLNNPRYTVRAIKDGLILMETNCMELEGGITDYNDYVDYYGRVHTDLSEGVSVQLIDNETDDVVSEIHFA